MALLPTMIFHLARRCLDAALLLLVVSNAYHIFNAGARLVTARNGFRKAPTASELSAYIADITHGL